MGRQDCARRPRGPGLPRCPWGRGGELIPWLCCSTQTSEPRTPTPTAFQGEPSALGSRAHLRPGHGHGGGQQLPKQEQGQSGGSGHGCTHALSGAGGVVAA